VSVSVSLKEITAYKAIKKAAFARSSGFDGE
jgi:hypothetical protein